MASDLIFEIGAEELPASFIVPALESLASQWTEAAKAARIGFASVETHGTPRRLALLVRGVDEKAPDLEERAEGPWVSVAFDAEGHPTKAAEGFAKKFGLLVEQLDRAPGAQGERLIATRKLTGERTLKVLPALLAKLIREIPFKKPKMRWAAETETFPRPVRWICAVFGGEVVPVKFAELAGAGSTYGHRFLAPGPIALTRIDEYLPKLREAKVLAAIPERRVRVVAEIDRVAAEAGGRRVVDEELVDTITGLVEWPSGVLGSFSEDVLDMPREVLVSEMRGHQKYASIESADGRLLPAFVAVANTPVNDVAVSRRGYERVLRARLADARYFFEEDKKRPLAARVVDLRRVTFQEKLGSIHDKVDRLLGLSRKVAMSVPYEDSAAVERTVTLCKADLTTGMVGEFPDLQGVMGREYAKAAGERDDVAIGIFEHYLPRGASDSLPTGDLGAIVGISDRLDTIAGIFAIGKAPSGANDPFALRRSCLGVIRTILSMGYRMSLEGLVDHALAQHYESFARRAAAAPAPEPRKDAKGKDRKPEYLERSEARTQILDFFRARLKALWSDAHAADVIEAVLAVGFDDVTDAHARLVALSAMRDQPDFLPLATAFARASNIIEKQAKDLAPGDVDATLFLEEHERSLFAQVKMAAETARLEASELARVHSSAPKEKADLAALYTRRLQACADLRPAVDAFFDKVLVMAEDPKLRENRLRLVASVRELFAPIAEFARIQGK